MLKDVLSHLTLFSLLKKNFRSKDAIALVLGLRKNKEKIFLPKLNRFIFFRNNTKDHETFEEIFLTSLYGTPLPFVPNTIIDAGANVGYASVFFHSKYPKAAIVALEIEKTNCDAIRKNTEGIENFELIEKGLYNKNGFFKVIDPYNATNSFQLKEVSENESYDIESITLDQIMTQKKWETIDILKIDIEGAEKDVFESNYENWLPKTKVIMVETHDRMIRDCSRTVINTINKYNFILFTTTEGTLIYFNLALVTPTI